MYVIHQEVQQLNATESLVGVISYSECADNPAEWGSLLGTMAVHPSHSHWAHEEIDLSIPKGENPTHHMRNFIKAKGYKPSDVMIYPLVKYEHGNILLSMGDKHICRFDSGIIGFIYAEKEKIRQEFGVKRVTKEIEAKVAKQFERQLELQSQYLNGEVYRFFIYRVNTAEFEKYGEHCLERSEVLDSCTGYYQKCDAVFDMLDMLENLSKNAA